jgi:hypothetical protein
MVSMSEKQLKEAFDRITPSDETKQAMLDNILKAAEAGQTTTSVVPIAPKRRKPSKLFDVALPIAACLVLLAGVGSLTVPRLLVAPGGPLSNAPSEIVVDNPEPLPLEPAPAQLEPVSPSPAAPGETLPEPSAPAPGDAAVPLPEPATPLPAEVVTNIETPMVAAEPSNPWLDQFFTPDHGLFITISLASIVAIVVSLVTLAAWAFIILRRRQKNK